MACGGCSERRTAIIEAGKAIAHGDIAGVAQQGSVIVASIQADVRRLALAASHARLKRR